MTNEDWDKHYWEQAQEHVGHVAQQDVYDALPPALKRRKGSARGTTMFEAVEPMLERSLSETEQGALWDEYNKAYDYWAKIRTGK